MGTLQDLFYSKMSELATKSQRKCTKYERLNRREINKKRKIKKHSRKHPNDLVALKALEGLL